MGNWNRYQQNAYRTAVYLKLHKTTYHSSPRGHLGGERMPKSKRLHKLQLWWHERVVLRWRWYLWQRGRRWSCQEPDCEEESEPYWVWDFDYPYEYLCPTHAEVCYCLGCHQFWAGCESFDFSPIRGICENCISEYDERDWDDWDGEWDWHEGYDPYVMSSTK